MISNEKKYFLNFVKDYLNFDKSVCNENLNWQNIYQLSRKHQITGIIFNQASSFISDDAVKDAMFTSSAKELVYYKKRTALYAQIAESFSKENIPFFSVKGLNTAKYYPNPNNRTMGDSDIIIPTEKLKKADKALKKLGFEYHQSTEFESIYKKNGMMFEIHDHLLYDEIANNKEDITFGDDAWKLTLPMENTSEVKLDESFHFIFLVLHLKKHLIHKGAGFRQFIDLYVTAKKANLDWNYIVDNLKYLDLFKFAQVCAKLTCIWFSKDSNSPYGFKLPKLEDEFVETATEKIFANGIFGFHDDANRHNTAIQNEILKEDYSSFKRFVSKIRVVFPRYNDIRFIKKYSFVDRRPYLLPIAWTYRIIMVIFGKHPKTISGNNEKFSDIVNERKNFLEKFGLI